MVLVDSSAFIEYLRKTGSKPHLATRKLVKAKAVTVSDVVVMEIIAGAKSVSHRVDLRRMLYRFPILELADLNDYETAGELYRVCRTKGNTIRNLTDCLVAVVAINNDLPLLHNDRDFDAIAEHSALKIYKP